LKFGPPGIQALDGPELPGRYRPAAFRFDRRGDRFGSLGDREGRY